MIGARVTEVTKLRRSQEQDTLVSSVENAENDQENDLVHPPRYTKT